MAYLRVPTPSPAGRTDRRLEYRLTTVSPIDSAFRLSSLRPIPLLQLSPSCAARSSQDSWVAHACWSFTPSPLRRPKPSPFRCYYRPSPTSLLPVLLLSLACIFLRSRRCNFQASRSDVLYPPPPSRRGASPVSASSTPVVVPLFRLTALGHVRAPPPPSPHSQDLSENQAERFNGVTIRYSAVSQTA